MMEVYLGRFSHTVEMGFFHRICKHCSIISSNSITKSIFVAYTMKSIGQKKETSTLFSALLSVNFAANKFNDSEDIYLDIFELLHSFEVDHHYYVDNKLNLRMDVKHEDRIPMIVANQ